MVAKSTQLRERASTELAKFHCSSSIVRSSLYRYAHRLSSRVKLLCAKVDSSSKQLPRALESTTYLALPGLVNGSWKRRL